MPHPIPQVPRFYFPGADKVVHGVMFAFLAGAIFVDFHRGVKFFSKHEMRLFVFCFVISSFFGGLIEILQTLMALGRSGDVLDLLADMAGALVGIVSAKLIFFKK